MNEPSILRTFFGGAEVVSFEEFAADVVKDEDMAREIALKMLENFQTYPYDGGDPRGYEEFSIHDAYALRRSLDPPAAPAPITAMREHLRALLDYDRMTERHDWEVNDRPEGHVYEHIRALDAWLECYLDGPEVER